MSEAEDAVQEAWLRLEASPTQPTSTRTFLSAVVTRISIDVLRPARFRREEYVGADPYEDPDQGVTGRSWRTPSTRMSTFSVKKATRLSIFGASGIGAG